MIVCAEADDAAAAKARPVENFMVVVDADRMLSIPFCCGDAELVYKPTVGNEADSPLAHSSLVPTTHYT